MKYLTRPFIPLAAAGLALSVVVHLAALLGLPSPLGERAWLLHVGTFVVLLPAILAMQPLTREFKQKDLWRAALRACPSWMRRMTYGFFYYAFLNFVIFMITDPPGRQPSAPTPDAVFRGFSGHWMAFYSAALAILYSAAHAAEHDSSRRCLAGHQVSPVANYCEECGQPVRDGQLGQL